MDHALTILIMAALMLASIGLIGRDLIRGADPKTRLIGGGVMTLGVVAAITIYSVYGDFGRPDAPLSGRADDCLLYTSPSPRDRQKCRMPASA